MLMPGLRLHLEMPGLRPGQEKAQPPPGDARAPPRARKGPGHLHTDA